MTSPPDSLRPGADGRPRCFWAVGPPEYAPYHDEEWGRPVLDDTLLFEHLSLEAFQSGLSWLTILRKRPAFRAAFAGFDPAAVADYGPDDIARLLGDAGIVRNRRKIEATIVNAGRTLELIEREGSMAAFFWSFRPGRHAAPRSAADFVATSPEATALAKELKRRGFRFVGPTTVYALMQATGIVDDHLAGCCVRDAVERERAAALRKLTPAR